MASKVSKCPRPAEGDWEHAKRQQAERFAEHMEQGVFLWARYSGLDAPGAAAEEINKFYARRCGVSVGPRFNQEVAGFINFSAGDVDARMRSLLASSAKS